MIKVITTFLLLLIYFTNFILSLEQSEINCLDNLNTKFSLLFNNAGYCYSNSNNIVCDPLGETVTKIIIYSYNNPNLLLIDDVKCLPNITSLTIGSLAAEPDFIYYKFPKVDFISLSIKFDGGIITKEIPTYTEYRLDWSDNFMDLSFKLSLFRNITTLTITGGSVLVDCSDPGSNSVRLTTFSISTDNILDLSYYPSITKITFTLSDKFNISSLAAVIPTVSANELNIFYAYSLSSIPFMAHLNFKVKFFSVSGNLDAPLNDLPFDLTLNTNYQTISINNVGNQFVLSNGKVPIKVNTNVMFLFTSNFMYSLPSISEFGDKNHRVYFDNNIINDSLTVFSGTGEYYSFNGNKITGTLDESWCNTEISIGNNLLTGTIPSCFSCYLASPIPAPARNVMFSRFDGNAFTNLDKSIPCTTFKPRASILGLNTFKTYGVDIGYNPGEWYIDTIYKVFSYAPVKIGKEYNSTMLDSEYFKGRNYFSIYFPYPGKQNYTFAALENITIPQISSVFYDVVNSKFEISGSYFSTYLGYEIQTFSIGGVNCIVGSVSFFNLNCSILVNGPSIPTTSTYNKIQVSTVIGTGVSRESTVYINYSDYNLNNKTCTNECLNGTICDISSGQCICNTGLSFTGCSNCLVNCNHGSFYCDITSGYSYCKCDEFWEGNDCSQISGLIVSSVNSTTTSGGIATFIGVFGMTHSKLTITIGGIDCPIIEPVTPIQIQCTASPGKGIQKYIVSQNGYTVSGDYQYIENIQLCPLNCSGNGVCNTVIGQCTCNTGYSSYDCSIKDNGGIKPPTNTTIDPNNGGTNTAVQEINFSIYFKSLSEIDINGNPIEVHSLQNNWVISNSNSAVNQNQFTFKQNIQSSNTCSIISTIEEVNEINGKQFEFANTLFTLDQGSIKFTISISNYTFKSTLNTLRLDLISEVKENQESECNSKDTEINSINQSTTFNYIRISKNNKILSGRFINKLMSDGKPTFLSTSIAKEKDSIIVSLSLPHCTECLLDPDFSVIISNDYKSECDDSSRKWLLPVAVVVPVVGVSLIFAGVLLYYKRTYVEAPLKRILKIRMNKV